MIVPGQKHVTNTAVAEHLEEIGDLLQIRGESLYRYQAYYNAANTVRALERDVYDVYQAGEITGLPRIGKGIGEKIGELVLAGRCRYLDELREEIPSSLRELLHIPGCGPKTAKHVYEGLGIKTKEELRVAAEEGRLRDLKGLGPKAEENILRGIAQVEKRPERLRLDQALAAATPILERLRSHPAVAAAGAAGSLRRMKDTIGDIDLLAASEDPAKVIDFFCGLPELASVLAKGDTKSAILTIDGLQVDLRVVAPGQWGAALQYFTGSKEHSVHLREIARDRGFKVNEYGVFEVETGIRLAGEREEEIYELLGMPLIPPVLREDQGEIEMALSGALPEIIERGHIRGDLHVHTKESDGVSSLEEIVDEALRLGYEYVLIADHAEKLHIAGGLKPEEVRKQREKLAELNSSLAGRLTILSGSEVNIDNDGLVDWPEDFLREFDLVVASIHTGFKQSREMLTARVVKAMENPHIHVIAHPTGRLIGARPPYELDMEEVFRAAARTGTALELNSFPDRLDLKDEHLRAAREFGARFVISTDAHRVRHMRFMEYGVATAQRGWVRPADVMNTRPLAELLEWAKDKSRR